MSTYATPTTGKRADAALLERVRSCYKLVTSAEADQRRREKEDLLFQVGENQWSEAAKRERMGGVYGGVEVPARPMLSISLLQQPMQLVYNQFTKARLGVNLHPVSEEATDELAEIKQGLYRRIERDGDAATARGWGFMRALACGRGWYRVVTRYDEDGDDPFDQEIAFERILHQENVYVDPASTRPDNSDAKWLLIKAWMDWSDFRREFPDIPESAVDDGYLGFADSEPDWVRAATDDKEPAILVCEYWYKEIARESVKVGGKKRDRETTTVYCAKVNGSRVLSVEEWNGRLFPIIPIIGRELQPVDGKRRWEGMIRPARDGQMLYNYAASTLVERMALEPKTPFIGAEGQFENYEHEWKQANTRNLPYLQYKPVALGDKPAPPPQRAQIDQSGMSLAMLALQEGKNFVQATTAVFEPSLGELPTSRDGQSGRAILALQQQTDAGTSGFMQSMAAVTLQYEAKVVLDLMPAIYDRPGRITRVLGLEDETKTVMLNRPFVPNAQGFPVAPGPGQMGKAKTYDLRKGKYAISVDVGKSHQTRLEAGQQFMAEVIQSAPALMGVVGDLVFKFRDEPGAKEISERLNRQIRATNPAVLGDEQGNDAEQAQAQVQVLTQQNQGLQQQLQQAQQFIQTKQAEQQAKVEVERIRAQTDLAIEQGKAALQREITESNNAAKILVARIGAESDTATAMLKAREELAATGMEVSAQAAETAVQHEHEERMAHQDRAHQVGMAAGGANKVRMSRTDGQDDEREESQETSDVQSSSQSTGGDE